MSNPTQSPRIPRQLERLVRSVRRRLWFDRFVATLHDSLLLAMVVMLVVMPLLVVVLVVLVSVAIVVVVVVVVSGSRLAECRIL